MESIETLQAANSALKEEIKRLKALTASTAATEEKEKEYQESQVRFRTVFETSRLGNKIINSDLEILQVNPALVALLGYDSKEEIVGTKIVNYTPEAYRKDWKFLQEKLWRNATPSFSLETCLQKRDGAIIWCQVTSIRSRTKARRWVIPLSKISPSSMG